MALTPQTHSFASDSTEYLLLTWDDVMTSSLKLARQVRSTPSQYDRIITLGKGGWPLARILADLLQLPEAASLGISFYDGLQRKDAPSLSQELPTTVMGQRVLLVDDVVDSGDSIEFAREYLQKMGVATVETAALYYKPRSSYKPDFFAEETTAWIIFPHEYLEGITDLKRKWMGQGSDEKEVAERLRQIGFPDELLEYAQEF